MIVRSRVIGGLQMIDGGEADDKIISVLENDDVWHTARNVTDIPSVLVERLEHLPLSPLKIGRVTLLLATQNRVLADVIIEKILLLGR